MDDELLNVLIPVAIPVLAGVATLFFVLHLAPIVLAAGAGFCGYNWYKRWRFRHIKKADKRTFIRPKEWADFEPGLYKGMLYLGNSQDGTIRYWYLDGYFYPQAVDNGEMYWDRGKYIENENLRKKLNGFQEMGNEWPAYYHEVICADERRKKILEKQKKRIEEMRQAPQNRKNKNWRYAATASSEFLNQHPDYLKDLNETVDELRKEIEGYCPTINFEALKQ